MGFYFYRIADFTVYHAFWTLLRWTMWPMGRWFLIGIDVYIIPIVNNKDKKDVNNLIVMFYSTLILLTE